MCREMGSIQYLQGLFISNYDAVDGCGRCWRLNGVGVLGSVAVMVGRGVAFLVAATVVVRIVVTGGHLCVGTFLVVFGHNGGI
jgi:hypothetical protein